MSSFLEYVPGTSPLHRMNPVAKLAAAAAFALACFCSSNLAFLAVLLAAGFALAATCGMVRPAIGLAKAVFAFSLILASSSGGRRAPAFRRPVPDPTYRRGKIGRAHV